MRAKIELQVARVAFWIGTKIWWVGGKRSANLFWTIGAKFEGAQRARDARARFEAFKKKIEARRRNETPV